VLNAVVGKLRTYERGDRTNVAIEPESITEVDEATRDVWVAETASQTRARLEAFETGDTPFSEEATEAYGEDVSEIEAAVSAVVPDDAA
jgi:RPA family protein